MTPTATGDPTANPKPPASFAAQIMATVTARRVRRTSPKSHSPKFSSAQSPTSNVRALTARLHPADSFLA